MRNQKGFTLIELIIVIVVLGILAVTAAPQFINFSGDARASALKGMEGSVKGATQLAYSKAAIEGVETQASASVRVKGNTNVALTFGYPAASEAGIISVLDGGFASDLSSDWVYGTDSGNLLIAQSSSVTESEDGFEISNIASSGCYLTYTPAAEEEDAGGASTGNITPASVTVTSDGC